MPINADDEILGGRPMVPVAPEETREERRATRPRPRPTPLPAPAVEPLHRPGNQRQEMPIFFNPKAP